MHDAFLDYLRRYSTTPLTENEIEAIKNVFIPKKIRKKQYFLQEGEVCKFGGFIVKGAMRTYSVDGEGAEHIIELLLENWWVADRESFNMLTPSSYNIDAWEDTDMLVFTKEDLTKYIEPIPAIIEMFRSLDAKHAFASQKRLNTFISYTAEKRYSELVKTYPEFLQRFPQHLIASYLGITKETLSRLRGKALKK
jgi:CRP-like cAMP-binding protein